ncbi:hypothetical protein BD626DRAFT_516901 [Schizophyllum amplum]|uniref:RNA-binding protein vts1-like alpha-helical domain-containing protein n=1 Tax=Schizophyllum amplum TaxID=97359 RepID=A0A550BWL8_9AGAR|nr:hypothetical protein BD626DRAFT_516901 [Auriculariopsis ampla]
MMSLRPPSSASRSPSPGPQENGRNAHVRQSMGPSARGTPTLAPSSPRPGGGPSARPTSELLSAGSAGMFQTPEAEALDQWFENLQNYEATLEEMAAASLDVNFKEELSAIEQWFKVLSEAERTAALYSLLQHSTQVQIRFFITVLQQMARSDPMTALLSPAMGSMQSQMEAKLASMSMKSPGLKSTFPSSPTSRSFNTGPSGGAGNRQSIVLEHPSNFLSPDVAANQVGQDSAAATLAQQRAKLKASNAAHRISAPVLSTGANGASWASAAASLGQVHENNNTSPPPQETGSRPKSTEFTGGQRASISGGEQVANTSHDNWASMVNTPLVPMFQKDHRQSLDSAASKLQEWSSGQKSPAPGVPRMGDPTIHKRASKNPGSPSQDTSAVYDDNGNLVHPGSTAARMRNVSQGGLGPVGGATGSWQAGGARSPALSNTSSNRYGNEEQSPNLSNLGMQMNAMGGGGGGLPGMNGMNGMNGLNGFNMGLGSPNMGMNGMNGMPGLGGMSPMAPFNLNMLSAMGISPEAQLLAAQMAASGAFGQTNWSGIPGLGAGGMGNNMRQRAGPPSNRSVPGVKSPSSVSASMPKQNSEEDVDPALLTDIPGWLRSLRLHKWQDMVVMDEAALEANGVAALGARRKMLKTFEIVRKKMGIEGPPSVPSSA